MPVTVIPYRAGEVETLPAPVYLDANFLVSWYLRGHPKYASARSIARELFRPDKEAAISLLAMDEAWWALLRAWYERQTGKRFSARVLNQDRTIVGGYTPSFRRFTQNVQRWPGARFIHSPDPDATIARALHHLTTEQLAPRDAFHLALIQDADAHSFITLDSDFDDLQLPAYELTVLRY